jgi:drug/metabolite transporter (DMT)-like permease
VIETNPETIPKSPSRLRFQSDIILFVTALVWGSGFIAQRVVANTLSVFQFNGLRFLIGALLLLPITRPWSIRLERKQVPWIALAGFLLFAGSGLQQWGLEYTTAGNAGFITGLYVVLVPIILSLSGRHRIPPITWLAAGLATVGVFLLSSSGALRLAAGDAIVLAGAFLWALHVIVVGRMSQRMDVLQFTIGQFFVCGVLNGLTAFTISPVPLSPIDGWLFPVLYSAVVPITGGFSLQAFGQRHAHTADAALILSLESVFAALFGYLLLGEQLQPIQILGCGLIMIAILLAQLRAR